MHINTRKQLQDMGLITASLTKKPRHREEKWLIQDCTAVNGTELRFKILSAQSQTRVDTTPGYPRGKDPPPPQCP